MNELRGCISVARSSVVQRLHTFVCGRNWIDRVMVFFRLAPALFPRHDTLFSEQTMRCSSTCDVPRLRYIVHLPATEVRCRLFCRVRAYVWCLQQEIIGEFGERSLERSFVPSGARVSPGDRLRDRATRPRSPPPGVDRPFHQRNPESGRQMIRINTPADRSSPPAAARESIKCRAVSPRHREIR